MPWNDACANTLIANVAYRQLHTYGASGTGICNTSPFNTTASYLSTGAGSGGASNCATGAGGMITAQTRCHSPSARVGQAIVSIGLGAYRGQAVYGSPQTACVIFPMFPCLPPTGVWGHFETVCWSDPTQTSGGAASCSGAPSTWSGFGGTSVASPTMAAIQALVNQKTSAQLGQSQSHLLPDRTKRIWHGWWNLPGDLLQLQRQRRAGAGCAFNDVTQGDIDLACRLTVRVAEHHCYQASSTNGVDSTDNHHWR